MLDDELAGTREFRMLTYSLEAVLAEKIVTMISRGDANTRDRDFGDVWLIGQQFEVDAATLLDDLRRTAQHRVVELRQLSGVLDDIRAARRDSWKRYRARTGMEVLPETFDEVLDFCLWFADPLVLGDAAASTWSPTEQRWTR